MNKKITEIIQIGENKISCCQSAKGYWYCSDITIVCQSIADGIVLIDNAINKINDMLEEKNKKYGGNKLE